MCSGLLAAAGDGSWALCEEADRDVPSTGQALPHLSQFDRLMTAFMAEQKPLGASLAIAFRGRLVYAKGFGHADLERQDQVEPTNLFRLASLSKPVTAAAVMKLVEQGKVDLDQPLIPELGLTFLSDDPRQWADPRLAQITPRQCLQHTAGFDKAISGDVLAQSHRVRHELNREFPLKIDDLLRFALSRPLDFPPGQRYAYANVGYLLLGRLIEQASGTAYETFVRHEILRPLGIHRMRLASTLKENKAPGEVEYLDARGRTGPNVLGLPEEEVVPFPYGIERIENIQAAGGWLGSAVDMVRFATGLFGFLEDTRLLEPKTLQTMLAPPPWAQATGAEVYYSGGWLTRPASEKRLPATTWHMGELAGVSTLLVSRADGVTWAVLFNQDRAPDGQTLAAKIDPLLHAPADQVKTWPKGDLFPTFL